MIGYEAGEVMRSGEIANTSPTATVYKKKIFLHWINIIDN